MTDEQPGDQQWVSDPRYDLNELRRPQFTPLKRGGVDPTEVDAYVTRLERLAKDFAKFTRELESRISHAKAETRDARDSERRTLDEAMLAAFEAKERILLQAEEKAWEIEEEARRRAAAIKESLGTVDAPDEEQVRLREQLGVYAQKVEDLEIQLERWQERATRLEADAQRHVQMAADTSERRREVEETASHANEVLATAERRAQALLAAARAEAAQIAADADADAERLRRRLATLEGEAATGPETEPEGERTAAGAQAAQGAAHAEAQAEAERIVAEAQEAADRTRSDAEELMSAARAAHQRLESRSAELLAGAERARAEAAAMRDEAEAIRRRTETEAAQMLAEASAIVEHARGTGPRASSPRAADDPAADERADPWADTGDQSPTATEDSRQDAEEPPTGEDRPSRYARRSAQLPSMGENAGDVLAAMTDLRRRLSRREDLDDT